MGRLETLDALKLKWDAMGIAFERTGTGRPLSRNQNVIFAVKESSEF